eukprot:m.21691 g.21691  ORF g.21691 m.21691 type:complete len:307 (-) comp8322_c0_seq2:352-1272(-)
MMVDIDDLDATRVLEARLSVAAQACVDAHGAASSETLEYLVALLPHLLVERLLDPDSLDDAAQVDDATTASQVSDTSSDENDWETDFLHSVISEAMDGMEGNSAKLQNMLVTSMVLQQVVQCTYDVVEEMEQVQRGDKLKEGQSCMVYVPSVDQFFPADVVEVNGEDVKVHIQQFNKTETMSREMVVKYLTDGDADDGDLGSSARATCELCERQCKLTRHHLIPRVTHNAYRRRGYTREHLNTCAMICRSCHSHVHRTESNQVLAKKYYTVEKLLEHPAIQKWVAYMSGAKVTQRYAQKTPRASQL